MTFLAKERSKHTFYEKIKTKAPSTQSNSKQAIDNFDKFCKEKFEGRNSEAIIREVSAIRSTNENAIFDILQEWANWNIDGGMAHSSLRTWFSLLNSYLYYRGIKLTPQDIRENLDFPKIVHEERHPLTLEEIHKIMHAANHKKKALYLALLSSGMRVGEAVRIRKKDLDITKKRIQVNIPASITKTKTARSVFISREAHEFTKPRLRQISEDDLVWGIDGSNHLVTSEVITFRNNCDKVGLSEKHESANRRKITLHAFRAYFFTKATRIHDENYAHKMTGHGGYLLQYDRLTNEEKLEMYLKLEPELLIFDEARNKAEIEKLQTEKSELEKKNEELQEMKGDIEKIKQRLEISEKYIKN